MSERGQKHLLNFQHLRRNKGLQSSDVARQAGVTLREEYLFELGCRVDEEVKQKVIHAFSVLVGHCYTLADFEQSRAIEEQPTVIMKKMILGRG